MASSAMSSEGAPPPAVSRKRSAPSRRPSAIERMLGGKLGYDIEDFCQRKAKRTAASDDTGHVADNIYLVDPKSLRIRVINWWHVFFAEYLYYVFNLIILAIFAVIVKQFASRTIDDLARVRALVSDPILHEVVAIVALIVAYGARTKPSVFCIENCVFVPPQSWQVSQEDIMTMMQAQGCFAQESLDFSRRLLERSGTGEKTNWPPSMCPSRDGLTMAVTNVDVAREEARQVIFPLVRQVLDRSGVRPEEIDILIINCSLFSPTPSLCALVCNEFCLREEVRTYNLGGMGCSANVVAVDLAKELLENKPGARALVISTENLTQNLYHGNEKSMLLQNTLFRCGGCALLLSSRLRDASRAKYKLLYTFRSQVSEDNSYNCVFQRQDSSGNCGVSLSKDIVTVAGKAMKRNFSKGIDHFCIHAGGRAVIEGVQKNLRLRDDQVAPSFMTLREWGNTSSSSIWYEIDWVERFGRLKRGDRVLQIAFGSGFKCNSAVWVALRVDAAKQGVPLRVT